MWFGRYAIVAVRPRNPPSRLPDCPRSQARRVRGAAGEAGPAASGAGTPAGRPREWPPSRAPAHANGWMAVRGPGWKALPQCTHMAGNDLVLLAGASRAARPVRCTAAALPNPPSRPARRSRPSRRGEPVPVAVSGAARRPRSDEHTIGEQPRDRFPARGGPPTVVPPHPRRSSRTAMPRGAGISPIRPPVRPQETLLRDPLTDFVTSLRGPL
jgi:hypothetical protein